MYNEALAQSELILGAETDAVLCEAFVSVAMQNELMPLGRRLFRHVGPVQARPLPATAPRARSPSVFAKARKDNREKSKSNFQHLSTAVELPER